MEKKVFNNIIDELCMEKEINQKKLSYGWIRELTKNNITKNIIHYQFDLNKANAMTIANDKYATYEILSSKGISTIEHKMLFNPKTRTNFIDNDYLTLIENMLKKYDNKIVLKANDSCQGKDVYLCTSIEEAKNVISKIFNEDKDSLSICPFKEIEYEYRTVFLDNKIIYVYKKKKPFVVGNGKNTIKELIEQKYSDMEISLYNNLDLNKITHDGEEIEISWKHNLSNGAMPIVIDKNNDNYIENVIDLALLSGKALDITFASIDIALTNENELMVMEVNGSVCMNKFAEIVPDGLKIAKEIYSKAIDKMFE